MTHYKLLDSRIGSLGDLLHGLKHSFEVIHEKLDKIDWYDGLCAKEESEFLLGIVFLGSQNYIHNTKEDFKEMATDYGVKQPCFTDSAPKHIDTDFILNVANYFKHHESWKKPDEPGEEDWSLEKDQYAQRTIQALKERGITGSTKFRCYEAYSLLFGENDIGGFSKLERSLVDWRSNLKQQLQSCIK